MPCATCGELTRIVEDTTGNTSDGPFCEKYKCLNGHRGTVAGDASNPPQQWSHTGPVFNEEAGNWRDA